MKAVALVPSFAALAFAAPSYEGLFEKFVVEYNKDYANDNGNEKQKRFEIFKHNVDTIYDHNSKLGLSYRLAVNKFADLTSEEFSRMYLGYVQRKRSNKAVANFTSIRDIDIADSLDWVAEGAVTAVKNQQQCGSCWAFSTTGSVEGALKVATNQLVSLSEQDLVSCDSGDDGCNGGLMDHAFDWIKENGICSESAYPYTSGTGHRGTCKKTCTPEVTVGGFVDVPQGDESALLKAVTLGPVSIAIEADRSAFQLYSGGVLDNTGCGKQLDHGVLLVGYGIDSGKEYWKVKNSWGADWGEDGYIRMVRNKDMCGIAEGASYPTGVKFLGTPPQPTAAAIVV